MKTFITVIITLFLTVLIVVGVGMALKSKGKLGEAECTVVRIERPVCGELVEFINSPGIIEPKRKVEISAKVSARISELPFEEGDMVKGSDPNGGSDGKGSILVRLDASEFEATLRAAEARRAAQAAQIDVAKVELESQRASVEGTRVLCEQAGRELKRLEKLRASGDVSQSELDQAESNLKELQARLDGAEHGLEAAELSLVVSSHNLEAADADISRARDGLGYTVISSPIEGVVTRINAEEGELVMTGTMNNPWTVIMEVADLSEMLMLAQVDETDITRITKGQRGRVHIDAWPDKVFEGVVDSTALSQDTARDGSKYFETKIVLDMAGERVFSGMTADVDIEICHHETVLKVPSQAVLGVGIDELPVEIRDDCEEVDKEKVYASVVYRCVDGEAVVTPVKIGESDATHTIILSGISEEDQVIVGPYKELEKIKHKQKVKEEDVEEGEKEEDGHKGITPASAGTKS